MPGQVAHQSTQALTSATLPYISAMAKSGTVEALKEDKDLRRGLNTFQGKITYESVARDLNMINVFVAAEEALGMDGARTHRNIKSSPGIKKVKITEKVTK